MRLLVSTTMRMPSGTSASGLLDDLLYQRVFSHRERSKGAVDNARGLTAYGAMLQHEPYYLLDAPLVLRQPAQQCIRHVYGDHCRGDTLLEVNCTGRVGYGSRYDKRHTVSSSRNTRSTEGMCAGVMLRALSSTSVPATRIATSVARTTATHVPASVVTSAQPCSTIQRSSMSIMSFHTVQGHRTPVTLRSWEPGRPSQTGPHSLWSCVTRYSHGASQRTTRRARRRGEWR